MSKTSPPPPLSVDDLDRLIHEPARLSIMLYLFVVDEADFTFLLHKTGLTRGNLSVHLQKLEQNGYLEIRKEFRNRVPHTLVRLSKMGRDAFTQYRERFLEILGGVGAP